MDQYYTGTVTAVNRRGLVTIAYDDGEVEKALDMSKEVFRPAQESVPPATTARHSPRGTKLARFDPKTHPLIPKMLSLIEQPKVFSSDPAVELHLNKALQGPDAETWTRATIKEFGRLAQGFPD